MPSVTDTLSNTAGLGAESAYFVQGKHISLIAEPLLQLSLDMHIVAGFDGHFKHLNPAWERVLGYAKEEMMAKPWVTFIHPDDLEATAKITSDLFAGREVRNFENRYRRKDGSYQWLEWNAVADLEMELIFAVGRDIRERKEQEKILRAQSWAMEQATEGIAHLDTDGRYTYVNEAYAGAVGYTIAEMMGMAWVKTVHRDDRQFMLSEYSLMRAGGKTVSEVRGIRKDGSEFFKQITMVPEIDSDGVFVGHYCFLKDITDRKVAEAALQVANDDQAKADLRKSEARYRFLADSMPQMVWTSTPDGTIDYFNRRWFEYTGMNEREPSSWDWKPILHPDDLESCIGRWFGSLQSGEPYEAEYRFKRRSDGEYRWHLARCLPFRDALGDIVQWVGTCTDIDDSKRAQAELVQTNAELETRVALRTVDLSREKALLQKAEEDLTRSNRDLEQYAYVASHDLQEPLRTVASFMDLLREEYKGQIDEQADRWIGYACDGAMRMQTLIQDLLSYSRIGTRGAVFEPCSLDKTLAFAMGNLKLSLAERHAVVTYAKLPTLCVDEIQITSLFQNLLANAIKYCEHETPSVHISVIELDAEWVFSVKDNGIGIDEEYQSLIFIIFQRLHGRSDYAGTGIGLAVCKKIVERHGGRIWVESGPGKGSTFLFTLPKRRADGVGVDNHLRPACTDSVG